MSCLLLTYAYKLTLLLLFPQIARDKRERNPADFTDERPEIKPVESKSDIFNIKKARYEVIRYGMSGFDKEQQTNSKIAMAIRLGAKVSITYLYFCKYIVFETSYKLLILYLWQIQKVS